MTKPYINSSGRKTDSSGETFLTIGKEGPSQVVRGLVTGRRTKYFTTHRWSVSRDLFGQEGIKIRTFRVTQMWSGPLLLKSPVEGRSRLNKGSLTWRGRRRGTCSRGFVVSDRNRVTVHWWVWSPVEGIRTEEWSPRVVSGPPEDMVRTTPTLCSPLQSLLRYYSESDKDSNQTDDWTGKEPQGHGSRFPGQMGISSPSG